MNTKTKGNIFEGYIESLYQSLGFKSKRNEIIGGQEVDIIAEKYIDGVGSVKILIECKYLTKGKVSNQIVIDFLSFLKSLPSELGITKGVIITNTGFSTQSKLINNKLISLVEVDELEKEILDLSNPLVLLKREYENENIYSCYIPLKGKKFKGNLESYDLDNQKLQLDNLEGKPSKPIQKYEYESVENVEEEIIREIRNYDWRDWGFISILGDYGSGKTTLMQRLFYKLNLMFLSKEIQKQPVYIELKNYYKFKDLDLFLSSSFAKLFNKEISIDLIRKEIAKGKFIFLLDGFDEMSPQISKKVRLDNFNALFPLLSSSISLITCRPSYFLSNREYNSYLEKIKAEYHSRIELKGNSKPSSLNIIKKVDDTYSQLFNKYFEKPIDGTQLKESLSIFISELSESQIDYFLMKFDTQFNAKCKTGWVSIKSFLLKIYDLSELMTKPLLLTLIKDTILLEGEKYNENTSLQFGPAGLYEVYTNLNLDFDWQKGETRYFLTKSQRREFAEAISIVMFDNNILEVQYEDLLKVVEDSQDILEDLRATLPGIELENIISDIQICSFITRTQEDKFRFVHKSFMEFFIAKVIKNIIINDLTNSRFEKIAFPKEVLYFLGSFALLEPSLKTRLHENINTGENKILRRNYTGAFLYSSPLHKEVNFRNVILNEINVIKTEFLDCALSKIQFIKSFWNNCLIKNGKLNALIFDDSELKNSSFLQVNGNVTFSNSKLYDFFINGANNLKTTIASSMGNGCTITYSDLQIDDCQFYNSKFSLCKIKYNSHKNIIDNCEFSKCELYILSDTNISGSKIVRTTFKGEEEGIITASKVQLIDCDFSGIEIHIDSLNQMSNCKGHVYIIADKPFCSKEKLNFDKKGFLKLKDLFIINLYQYEHRSQTAKKIVEKRINENKLQV